jgi:hypothetical protein
MKARDIVLILLLNPWQSATRSSAFLAKVEYISLFTAVYFESYDIQDMFL